MTLINGGDGGQSAGGTSGSSNPGDSGAGGSTPPSNAGSGAPGGSQSPGTGSGSPTSWRDSLPVEMRSEAMLANIPDLPTLAKSYMHAQGLIGKKGVFPPGENASKEDRARFYKELGQPEYEKFTVKNPDGTKISPEFTESFRKIMHNAGVRPQEAQEAYEAFIEMDKVASAKEATANKDFTSQQLEAYKKELGDNYEENVRLANLAAQKVMKGEFAKYLVKTGLADDVMHVRYLAEVGKMLAEHKLVGNGSGKMGDPSSHELKGSIDRIFLDPEYGANTPRGRQLSAEMEKFQRQMNPA